MKHPTEADFTVQKNGSSVIVTFRPTESYYTFPLLPLSERAKHGKVSRNAKVRHAGKHGDTDRYMEQEVFDLAFRLAEQSSSRVL
jgi:hypothetical protein